jgi:hypothetical protein
MKKELDEILKTLAESQHPDIVNCTFENGICSFEYAAGRFVFIKSQSPDLKTGFLTLYHETPLEGDMRFIEINDFIIKVSLDCSFLEIKIKNHFLDTAGFYGMHMDDEGYLATTKHGLINELATQLRKKLINDNFRIYLAP